MINANPYQQYQQSSVMSAGRGDLTLMLFNGAVKFISQGVRYIEEKNVQGAHKAIVRTQEIIVELQSTLNMDYEISSSLALLYEYLQRRLVEANTKKDREILTEVLGLVTELRDTWAQAVRLSRSAMSSGL